MIQVKDLCKAYQRGTPVLKNISFTLPDKGFVCILGPSGCGKTSLLNAIGGLDRFDSGNLTAGDTTVKRYGTRSYEDQRNRNFGYIFQNYYLLEDHSAAYNVYLGLHSLDLSHREKLQRVRRALQAVDMERYFRRKVSDLSGGQQQRIAIARALARRPRVIFADEPTGNLDEANTHNICALLRQVSRESLVVMVTHEERIARFYADRIITLDAGRIVSDDTQWQREALRSESDKVLYAGDLQQQWLEADNVQLRLLRSSDAAPVELTVVALKDKLILQTGDTRTVMLSRPGEPPEIREGHCPVLTLESMDREKGASTGLFDGPPAPQARAGKGLKAGMLLGQARLLMQGKGLKKRSAALFLALLTALTLVTVGDFIALSHVDPQDFITTDSHVLVLKLETGTRLPEGSPEGAYTWKEYFQQAYKEYLLSAPLDMDLLPLYGQRPKYYLRLYHQLGTTALELPYFNYVSLDRLEESQLLCGRMPENSQEIVVDKILLEAILDMEDVVANSITDLTVFLDQNLHYSSKKLNPVIVGISDSGERAVYATDAARLSMATQGVHAITLSELRQRFPGKYEDVSLEKSGCLVNIATAGEIWKHRVGQAYGYAPNVRFMEQYIDEPELSAAIVVTDESIDQMLAGCVTSELHLYCADKEQALAFLAQKTEMEQQGYITVSVSDPYSEKYAQYAAAASVKADGRTIVTFTVLLLSAVMLYLLSRSRARERIGMLAVYRLLGIPGRKAVAVFALESLLTGLLSAVPTAAAAWLLIQWGATTPELAWPLLLPRSAAVVAVLGILAYHMAVSLLPLRSLLSLPPAQLAAKYDM